MLWPPSLHLSHWSINPDNFCFPEIVFPLNESKSRQVEHDYWERFHILIDSGKYAAAHNELSDFVRRMEYSKIILLMSTSSDQSLEDVIKSGKILSSLADETLLFDESPDTTVHDTISLIRY